MRKWAEMRRWQRWGLVAVALYLGTWMLWEIVVRWATPDCAALVQEAVLRQDSAWLDRKGKVLRLFPDQRGDFALPVPLASVSRHLRGAMLAAEDRNFHHHRGFDPWAMGRALWQNIRHRRVVSGASTISQQIFRILIPRPRSLSTKIAEILLAARLERQWPKERILAAYLNLAPMYGNIRGVGLASQLLFRKDVALLGPIEAAVLAALPQSPARLDPTRSRNRPRLQKRRNWILGEMAELGFLSPAQARKACQAPLRLWRRRLPNRAPHFTDWLTQVAGPPVGRRPTSLDPEIQTVLERVMHTHQGRLGKAGAFQGAGMVVDTRSMQILAWQGSFTHGPTALGFNNGCLIPRSGGSTLKPFLYALALETGLSPASLISDTGRTFRTPQGDYLPYNADRRSYGPVTIRVALGNSLNISAVKTLNDLGLEPFFRFLVRLGILASDGPGPAVYGLGLAIGNPDVTMTAVLAAYASLAHGGRRVLLHGIPGQVSEGEPVMSRETAWLVLDMLSDPSARLLTFGNPRFFAFDFPVALKTGTSTNYRDSWLFAVTPRYLVGLWVGNFDGRPTYGLSGATACGPILKDLLEELLPAGGHQVWFPRPPGVIERTVCGISGQPPTPFCPVRTSEWFDRRVPPAETCPFHQRAGGSHELPPDYADWLEQRRSAGLSDPFTLEGNLAPDERFAMGGTLPGMSGGVRLASGGLMLGFPASATEILPSFGSGTLRVVGRSEGETGWGRLAILSPHNGDRFVRMPGGENLIRLRAVPEIPLQEVVWLVDGVELARTGPPYEAFWTLAPGAHVITALSPGEEAAQVRITVE